MISPYNRLHIYYLKGRIKPGGPAPGPDFIGNWEEGDTSFLFFKSPARPQVEAILSSQPHLELTDVYEMSYDDWHGAPLTPMSAGRFLIVPPWMDPDLIPGPSEIRITLDPGVVFGAGNHPTTCDCLFAIELIAGRHPVGSALDLGTGTGVLALAAAKMGSRRNLAVDSNFLAAKTAAKNISRNHLDGKVLACCGLAEDFMDIRADLLIANIHFDVMRRLVAHPGFLEKKWFILSGMLSKEAMQIEKMCSRLPVSIIEKRVKDGIWHTFCGSIG